MKIFIVALMSLCATSAFAQQGNQSRPLVGIPVAKTGTLIPHSSEGHHSSDANGVSQERVISSSAVQTAVVPANTEAPIPQETTSFGNGEGTAAAMPHAITTHTCTPQMGTLQAGTPQAAKITIRANEKAPAPVEHSESSGVKSEQK